MTTLRELSCDFSLCKVVHERQVVSRLFAFGSLRQDTMHSAAQVACYFISLADEDAGDAISNLMVQKLLYYAQGYSLALHGRPLFEDAVVAWTHGPAVAEVFHAFKVHGCGPIPLPEGFDALSFDKKTRALMDEVYDVYGQYSPWRLRSMTRNEAPWKRAYRELPGSTISHSSLKRFFKALTH